MLVAVSVHPLVVAVRKVTLNTIVPELSAVFGGSSGFGPLEVTPTTSLTLDTKFQFASTALTVTLNAVPAVCAVAVPVLPVPVPGAAVSPGSKSCNFVNTPAVTGIDELVLLVIPACVTSEPVTVALPPVFNVTLKLLVPLTSAALAGSVALLSLEVIATVSFVLIKFQFASTALTVTLKAVPAAWVVGVPVLPLTLPGEAASPGASTCSFANAPAFTVIDGVVLFPLLPFVTSDAVNVWLPPVLKVTFNVFVPATSAVFAGSAALASLELIATVSLVLIRFQFASTAFTVTLKAVPAV